MAGRQLSPLANARSEFAVAMLAAGFRGTVGLGCMRLSTASDRDDVRSTAVIHAALDAGVTLLDTSDAYCLDESDTNHNERLIAAALRSWPGDRSAIEVATKGGVRRPGGQWVAEGRAKHLRSACAASLDALGVATIDLYQLHVVDPKTPLETSVRALAALQGEGKVRRIGLCNVTVGQIVAARQIAEISSVQVSLSVLDDESLRNGVAEYCRDEGIRLIAYRPLGGVRASRLPRDPVLAKVAARHGATPHEIALAWLTDLGAVAIPGATREATARSIGHVLHVRLTDDDRRVLDERFSGRLLRVPRAVRRPPPDVDPGGEVVLIMGMPGAGKSSVARELASRGYERLNRDERGGTLSGLVDELDAGFSAGRRRWVLDNTYPSRSSRNEVIECAWAHGVPVRCVHLTTSTADAQINAISRLIELHGRLPMPEELRERGKDDPRYFGPDAQFRYERTVEPPTDDEGFTSVQAHPFVRDAVPNAAARGVFLEYDDVLCIGAPLRAQDVALADGARETLQQLHAGGWLLSAHAWRPQIARGGMTRDAAEECFARTRELLGVEINLALCPHDAGPPICWCRKPLPGLILEFALPRHVALERSVCVGRSAADRTLSQRLGLEYRDSVQGLEELLRL
jgi:aryl-alcohol dehydrogenase-like predicted oxidoreductase/histidinol phosphatase-like enzyme